MSINSQVVASTFKPEADTSNKYRLMLFELSNDGHYPGYIQHLIEYWCEQKLPGTFNIIVSPQFREQNSNIIELVQLHSFSNINFISITPEENNALVSSSSSLTRAFRAFQEWNLIYKYAVKLKSTHCLLTYFDTRQLPLALGAKLPCHLSSIYFRPTLHYGNFTDPLSDWKDWLQQWREKLLLSRIFRQTQLKTLFCLDPFAVKYLKQFSANTKLVYLPDPIQNYEDSEFHLKKLMKDLGIEAHRQVFLLFGALTRRKGIVQLLEAVSILPSNLCQKLCLLLVGPLGSNQKDKLQLQLQATELSQSLPVQIIIRDQFFSDREIQPYFKISDVILCPYQRHVGMSAILVRAAAAQKPVLAQSYGLMGEITRLHQLGLTVNSSSYKDIAQGLSRFLLESPEQFCNPSKMKIFADQNSPEKFSQTIFQDLSAHFAEIFCSKI